MMMRCPASPPRPPPPSPLRTPKRVPPRSVEARRHEHELRRVRVGDGHDELVKGQRILGVAVAGAVPGDVDVVACARASPDLEGGGGGKTIVA